MNIVERLRAEWVFFANVRRILAATKDLSADSPWTLADEIERAIDRYPDNIAIRFEGRGQTYAELETRANRYAHWARGLGLKPGDVVALFMGNQPDYIAIWLGLNKVGVVVALVNANITGAPLAHTLNISNADHVILASDLAEAYHGVEHELVRKPTAWALRAPVQGARDLNDALGDASPDRPDKGLRADLRGSDLSMFLYTSGTTGAPKAARFPHWKALGYMRGFAAPGEASPKDITYVPLPLYHGTGGICGVGFALTVGGTLALKRKFSASQFWEDVAEERATAFFYIGELCRYLLNQPPHPKENAHGLRIAIGNGLRPEVWERFQPRFKIPRILEFYGSTEGNVSFANYEGKIGAIGRIPVYLRSSNHIRLVKFDIETEQPVRGPDGLCIEADVDEAGEALGKIDMSNVRSRFEGYSGDAKQTEKKILRDVFEKGDAWFRTGDLLRRDKDYYFYFVDRIGDTFRWKGENVSTNEVGDVITQHAGVVEANVYGVKIPGQDGRAGMAAVTLADGADLADVHRHIAAGLPAYARPLFLRLQPQIETTGTFKYRKVDLVQQGFDPDASPEPILFDDHRVGRYVPMTKDLYAEITAGAIRL